VITNWGIAGFRRDQRNGALKQLRGAGCLGLGEGCKPLRHIRVIDNSAISPDGRHLYLTSDVVGEPSRLVVVRRNPATGGLSPGACIAAAKARNCRVARGLEGVRDVVISPDGRTVYTSSSDDPSDEDAEEAFWEAVAVFTRDPASGELRQPRGDAGCLLRVGPPIAGCAIAPRWLHAHASGQMVISPSGNALYLVSSRAVAALGRDVRTGRLDTARRLGGCLSMYRDYGCRKALRVRELANATLAPDGRQLYVGAYDGLEVVQVE
jgi:hypothetical protein